MQETKVNFLNTRDLPQKQEDLLAIHSATIPCSKFLDWIDDLLLECCVIVTNESASRTYRSGLITETLELYLVRNWLYTFLNENLSEMDVGDSNG